MHVHGAFFNVDVPAPDLVQQPLPAINPFRMGNEKMQQAEFSRADSNSLPVNRDPDGVRVQCQSLDGDDTLAVPGFCPPHDCPDTGQEFPG